jgi:hypothetical protein
MIQGCAGEIQYVEADMKSCLFDAGPSVVVAFSMMCNFDQTQNPTHILFAYIDIPMLPSRRGAFAARQINLYYYFVRIILSLSAEYKKLLAYALGVNLREFGS